MPRILYGTVALRQLLQARTLAGGSTRTGSSRHRVKEAKRLVGKGAAALTKNVGQHRCLRAVVYEFGLLGAYCGSVPPFVGRDCGLKFAMFVGRANFVCGPLHLADLVATLHELQALGVGFISLREALDFTTPTGRAWRDCSPSLRSLNARFYASASRRGLSKPANAAPGMGDHRRSPTGEMRCAISIQQVRARRRLPGGWGSAEPQYDGFSAKRRCPISCKIGTVTNQWR
jgi:hypothetical protein